MIQAPFACRPDLSSVGCAKSVSPDCLSEAQILAVQAIYGGPKSPDGRPIGSGGPLPGSEYDPDAPHPASANWAEAYGIVRPGSVSDYVRLAQNGFRFMLFDRNQPAAWSLRRFDFDRDPARLRLWSALYDADNPDLGAFRARGGKLLMFAGLNDDLVPTHMVTDYYAKVTALAGGATETRTFARLFVLPGVEHCFGGPGADTIDYLSAIERWVTQGQAPDALVAYHLTASPQVGVFAPFPLDPRKIVYRQDVRPFDVGDLHREGR